MSHKVDKRKCIKKYCLQYFIEVEFYKGIKGKDFRMHQFFFGGIIRKRILLNQEGLFLTLKGWPSSKKKYFRF